MASFSMIHFALICSNVLIGVLSSTQSPSTCHSRYTWTTLPDNTQNGTSPFKDRHGPSITTASDPRYDYLRRSAQDITLNSNAAYIIQARSAQDVVDILQAAVNHNLRPTVRSGGHCYTDFWSSNPAGVLIDISGLDEISTAKSAEDDDVIWVGSGAKLEYVYTRLYKDMNVAVPLGVCLDLGLGGFVLGGGYGYLARKYGLLIDYVSAIQIAYVTEEKEVKLITVQRDSVDQKELDLFWALRGAGQQNFGVITSVAFSNLPQPGFRVYKFDARWDLVSDMEESSFLTFLDKYIKFWVNNSGVHSEYCDMFSDLNIYRGGNISHFSLRIMLIGDNRQLVSNFLSTVGLNEGRFSCELMSYFKFAMVNIVRNDLGSDGSYFEHGSAYMVGPMPAHQLRAIWHYFTDTNYSYAENGLVQIRSYGCAVNRFEEDSAAYPHRKAVIKIQYLAYWQNEATSEAQKAWLDDLYTEMYGPEGPLADHVMDGCYVGYANGTLVNWRQLYYKGNYDKLKRVKKDWDPLNIFHHRQSIELPSS